MLRAKLGHLDEWNTQRRTAAQRYDELLEGLGEVVRPAALEGNLHVWHLYVVRIPHRNAVLAICARKGSARGFTIRYRCTSTGLSAPWATAPAIFPEAELASEEILSLPIFPGITEREQEYVVDSLLEALRSLSVTAK